MKRSPVTHGGIFSDEDFAQKYAEKHRKMAENFGREYTEKLSSRSFERGRILDVGCGFGGTAIALAQAFPNAEILGVDLSDPLLQIADQTAKAADLQERVTFEKEDVHRIPYEDDSFEVVLNIGMVHLVDDPIKMLDEMERVLVPDGFLFIADLRRSWLGLIEKEIKSALTLEEARDVISQSELREGTFSSDLLWWRFET
jgi:ubiquinone/menaquinone biosynthesis C-methylase UbiE